MDDFTDGIKKLLLAGLGAAAATGEKSKELLDKLVAKGELTVEQGKALNQELRHKREMEREAARAQARRQTASELIYKMTPEERAELKSQLEALAEADEAAPMEDDPMEETILSEEEDSSL